MGKYQEIYIKMTILIGREKDITEETKKNPPKKRHM